MSDDIKIIKRGPRGEYDLMQSLRRAKVTNMTGACFSDHAADEIAQLQAENAELVEVLEDISDLIAGTERRAQQQGTRLNDIYAVSLAKDLEYLKSIAASTSAKHKKD